MVGPLLRAQWFTGGEEKMLLGPLRVGKLTGIVLAAPDIVLHGVWPGHSPRGSQSQGSGKPPTCSSHD